MSIWAITSLSPSWKSHGIELQRYTCREIRTIKFNVAVTQQGQLTCLVYLFVSTYIIPMQADSWLMSTKLDRYVAYFKSFMGVYERGPKDATFSMGDPSRGRNSVPSQQSLAPLAGWLAGWLGWLAGWLAVATGRAVGTHLCWLTGRS